VPGHSASRSPGGEQSSAPDAERKPTGRQADAAPAWSGAAHLSAAGVLALQRRAGNRAVTSMLTTRRLARQEAPIQLNPSAASHDEIFAARNRVSDWMRQHAATDPQWAEMQSYAEALEAEIGKREGRHTGGATAGAGISGYDANVRIKNYVEPVKELSKKVLEDYQSGKLSHLEAREAAASGRNAALGDTRGKLSPGGRAFSEGIKEEGMTLEQLASKYATQAVKADPAKFGLAAEEVGNASKFASAVEKAKSSAVVSEEIIKAAGRTGKAVTVVARVSRVAGPVGMAAGLAISGYEVYDAPPDERARVAVREGGGFAGGLVGASAGGLVAGWAASLACGPGAPVCAIVISLVIVGAAGYAGGRAGESSANWVSSGGLDELGRMIEGVGEFAKSPAVGLPATTLGVGGGFGGLMERDRRRAYSKQPAPAP
jgi:hypothetical protein